MRCSVLSILLALPILVVAPELETHLIEDELDEEFLDRFTPGNEHARFERAIVVNKQFPMRRGQPIIMIKKRRNRIIKCCGRRSCSTGRRPTPNFTPADKTTTETQVTKEPATSVEAPPQVTTVPDTTLVDVTTVPAVTTVAAVTTVPAAVTTVPAAVTTVPAAVTTVPAASTTVVPTTTTIPTTTTKPPLIGCNYLTCPKCGPPNETLWNTTGKFLSNAADYGNWQMSCDKLYLFSSKAMNWNASFTFCCDLNMTLVTLADTAERTCMHTANDAQLHPSSGTFYTSSWDGGASRTPGKNHTLYCWCGREKPMIENWFLPNEPSDGGEDCGTYILNKGPPTVPTINDVKCDSAFAPICEGPTTTCTPQCPVYECTTDPTLFSLDGALLNPAGSGIWKVPDKPTCDNKTLYLFSSISKNYEESARYCCAIGMKVLSVETADEHKCLTDTNNAEANWSFDYWTSATNLNCKFGWQWCNSNTKQFYPGTPWVKDQPDYWGNGEWCGELRLRPGADNNTGMNDFGCNNAHFFICEGPTTTTTTCKTPTCTDIPCDKDATLFKADGALKEPQKFGKFVAECGSLYMFSAVGGISYCSARKICCSLGMQLLSVETNAELHCLYDLVPAGKAPSQIYWTSAVRPTLTDPYIWCPSNTPFNTSMFIPGMPNNAINPELCMFMVLDGRGGTRQGFDDAPAHYPVFYMCEASDAMAALPPAQLLALASG